MMQFRFLEEAIPSITIDLVALRRDTPPYSMLLYQHEGTLFASAERVGNKDQEYAGKQLGAFLTLAKDRDVDLAITPEYVVPWEALGNLLDDEAKWPNQGRLWVLGMESTGKDVIQQFSAKLNDPVHFQYEERVLQDNKNFLDPVVYLFRARVAAEEKLIVLVQFKTHHMGVWRGGDIERDNMIEGQLIYVLRNSAVSQHLFTVICSEAMNLPDNLTQENRNRLQWSDMPYLILNPQVNPGPVHANFLNFRNQVFRAERKEIITLNWSSASKIMNESLAKDGSTRSGIFVDSIDVKFTDLNRFKNNHSKGLYYFYYGKRRHAFLLNSAVHAFALENVAVNINSGVPAQQMRNGPAARCAFRLMDDMSWETIEQVSDGHLDFLAEQECKNAFLLDAQACILEKEKLVCISTGNLPERSGDDWSELDKLSAIKFDESLEVNRRLTVAQDRDKASYDQRYDYIESVGKLENKILRNGEAFPDSLAKFRSTELHVGFSQKRDGGEKVIKREYFRYNIVSADGEMITATICFVSSGGRTRAEKVYKSLRGLFDSHNMNRSRVVVYYEVAGDYRYISDPNPASIVSENSIGDDSILRSQL